jgi:hypothetical protein
MGVKFAANWKQADPYYTKKYGQYQAFLDSVNQQQIMQALWLAKGHFLKLPAAEILNDASSTQDVTVEQGLHQTENLNSGGFTLHFTVRNSKGKAFHLYVAQRDNGSIYVQEITWGGKGGFQSDFYNG